MCTVLDGAGGNHRRMACLQTCMPGEGVSNLWERFVGDRAALSREFSRNSRPGVFAQKARISKEKWGCGWSIDGHDVRESGDDLTHENHGNHGSLSSADI